MKFIIRGEPIPKGRPKIATINGHAVAYTPKRTRDAETDIRAQITTQLPNGFIPFECPLKVSIIVRKTKPKSAPKKKETFPITNPDIDNYLKIYLDAMNKVVFRDDALILEIYAKKEFGVPGADITIEKINQGV